MENQSGVKSVSLANSQSAMFPIQIENKELWGIYDTAAEISLVEKEIWDQIKGEVIAMTRLAVGFDGTIVQLTHVKRTKIEIETLDRKRREKMVQIYLGPIGKRRVIVGRQDKIELRF
jgi:hypothetical protein